MKSIIQYSLSTLFVLLLSIHAIAQPNADFTANVTSGCVPLLVQFECHSSTAGSGYSHSWDLGGPTSTQANPSRVFTTAGTYTIKHTVTGPGGNNSITKTNFITVHPTPIVDFDGSPLIGCPPLTVNFKDKSTPGTAGTPTYTWVVTNNAPLSGPTPSNVYNDGPYDVSLTVTNSKGCSKTLTKQKYVDVYPRPTVSFQADKLDFCSAPATVNFTSNASGNGTLKYSWDFGDGSGTSTAANPSYTYNGPAPQSYTVRLTVTDDKCGTTVTKSGYIKIYDARSSFNGPATACPYQTVTFTNTSPSGATSQEWDMGDGNKQYGQNATHMYGTPGTYTVTLKTNFGGCVATSTKQITIRPKPNLDFDVDPDTLCPAPQTVKFNTKNPMVLYSWNFGDNINNTSTLATPTHTYNNNGQYSVTIIGTDNFGCKDTFTKYYFVKIFPLELDAGYVPKTFCVPMQVDFYSTLYRDSGILYPYPVKKWEWTFGDGGTASTANPSHTYIDTGRFIAKVKITTIQDCVIEDTMLIEVGAKPFANFSAMPTTVCNRQSVYFTSQSTGYNPLRHNWDFGDGGRSNVKDPVYSYNTPGKYTVTLVVSHYMCMDDTIRKEYIRVLEPKAVFEAKKDCDTPLKMTFINKSIGDSSSRWLFGDGNQSTQRSPVYKYGAPGKYTVWLIVFNSTTNCYDSTKKEIYVGPNSPNVIANKTVLCPGDSVAFYAYMIKDTSYALFDWYVNNVLVYDTFANYTHTFTNPGVYSIKVVSKQDCYDTIIKTNWITVTKPTVGFTADTTFACLPDTVMFADTSKAFPGTTITRRVWRFGISANDSLVTGSTNVSNIYPNRGDYGVTLILTDNNGCKDSAVRPNYIHALKPVASFTVNSNTVCVNGNAMFTNTSTNHKKSNWYFGDNTNAATIDAIHKYGARGVYEPVLVVTDSIGCTDTFRYKSITAIKPYAAFTASDSVTVCPEFMVKFTNASVNAKNYKWNFDNGNNSTFIHPTVVFKNAKEYNVQLVAIDSIGCTDTATKKIQVLGYAGAFNYSPLKGCVPLTVNFSSQVQGQVSSMIWDFGDGTTQRFTGGTLQYTYTTPGSFVPKIVFNDGKGCTASSDGKDPIEVDAAIADFETGPACQYSQVQFTSKAKGVITAITNHLWTFHDGTFNAQQDPRKLYGPAGKYMVKLEVKNVAGCKDTLEKEITINVPMEASAGADTVICLSDGVTLNPTGGVSYTWAPGATLSCTGCTNPVATPKEKTIYTMISTDVNGCHDTDKVEVGIKTHVTSVVGKGGEICEGDTIMLHVSGAKTYKWSPEHTLNDATSSDPIANPKQDTKYNVVAYEGSCIPDTSAVDVIVHPKPTVNIRGGESIVAGTGADLLASGQNIVRFLWTPSNTLSCPDCANPTATPFKTTTYTVKVYTKFDCVDSGDVTVKIICDEKQLYIPNTFTPNGDGMNDIFMVRGAGISSVKSFRIFNRWGELIFERSSFNPNDKAYGWDGSHKGNAIQPDVYVYFVEAYCENGELLTKKGDVTIIR